LERVRDRMARAADRAGREPGSIRLVAVSKTFSADHIRAAADAGQLEFGENKLQEALPKMDQTTDLPLRWHFVGHLQSNKARRTAERFHAIHSVDDRSLVTKLDLAAGDAGRTVDVLLQVNLASEPTKHGADPATIASLIEDARGCQAVRIKGLMLLPPAGAPEQARPYFAALRRMRDELVGKGVPFASLAELSMGMSGDFEVAIEEGATIVRIGTALFGARA
jgi:PLP dependent protein